MEFRFRSAVLLILFSIWAVLIAVCLFQRAVLNRDRLTVNSDSIAKREGVLPAVRGRILDRNGVPLAWTEMRTALFLHRSPDGNYGRLPQILREYFHISEIPAFSGDQSILLLADDLPIAGEDDLRRCYAVVDRSRWLTLKTYHSRKYAAHPGIPAVIGSCGEDNDGILCGVSGLEKEYETELSGKLGIFRVALDRRGKWIPGTLVIQQMPVPGNDVTLTVSLQELTGGEGDEK